MCEFFIPNQPDAVEAERDYVTIRELAADRTGESPRSHRIASISCRLQGADVVAEVGQLDPLRGRLITAILDMGRAQPYLIHCGPASDPNGQILVNKPVYDVTEFDTA